MQFLKSIYYKSHQLVNKFIRRWRIQIQLPTIYLGSDYGGWAVYPDNLNQKSIVYSFGVGEDISWDVAMIEQFDVQLFAFDPTPRSITFMDKQTLSNKFAFLPYGIAEFDGMIEFFPPENPEHVSHTILDRKTGVSAIKVPVKTFKTICDELGHTHIDILKMDIEGAEYSVLDDILKSDISISQILVEFHDRWEHISTNQTRATLKALYEHGYRIFAISPTLEEYSLILVNQLREISQHD